MGIILFCAGFAHDDSSLLLTETASQISKGFGGIGLDQRNRVESLFKKESDKTLGWPVGSQKAQVNYQDCCGLLEIRVTQNPKTVPLATGVILG
jgi:hypothetical protein